MEKPADARDYDAIEDPYCYPGTTILNKNIPDIREQAALGDFEAVSTTQRSDEPLPNGRLSVRHYRAIHHHLFQDVYAWAGTFRTVRIGKDGHAFCYPENIASEMKKLFSDLKRKRYLYDAPRRGGSVCCHPPREFFGLSDKKIENDECRELLSVRDPKISSPIENLISPSG